MFKHYVVCMRSDIEPGDIKIVGPFKDIDAASAYGAQWQWDNDDNPCWQALTLPDGFVPSITAPESDR
jgi:hypothetical protein